MTESLAARAENWALTLTRLPSVTGTKDEIGFAGLLSDLLRARPAFHDRHEDVWTIPTGDRLGRSSGPAVVVGFASIPYLPTVLGDDPAARRLDRAARHAAAVVAARHGITIGIEPYFPGISDMSFLGQGDEASIDSIAANTPAWGFGLSWPEGAALAQIPIINAGPWGRDYHTPLERLHTGYAFTVLPDLIQEIARRVMTAG